MMGPNQQSMLDQLQRVRPPGASPMQPGAMPMPPNGNAGVTGGALDAQGIQPPAAPKPNATIGSVMPMLREKYQHTPQDLQRAFQENPDAFAGASIMGSKGDKIKFSDGNIFDVINSAGAGGKAWQELWDNDPNAPPPMRGSIGGGSSPDLLMGLGGGLLKGDPSARIQQALGQVQRPNFEALLAALSSGGV